MKKMKLIALVGALVVSVAAVLGCTGQKTNEVWPEKWDAEATAYFNANVPPLKNLPGKVYHFQVVKYEKGKGEFFANSLYIDGKLVENDLPNASHKVGGVSAGQLESVHIVFTAEEGYKVATKYALAGSIQKAVANTLPVFFKDYL